ncbi:phosphatidylinositol-glycan biosynthesis class W protein-like [Branchiostoma lanceolatum]|uniref:phosphatidylinositol-glycan biosynthesis class W protein-like n=1 Tax=Branchiostoma lanceolatum TaxID=7740 RepID=UPI003453127D
MSYKAEKEAFVGNLNGTTVTEIALINASAPLAVLLRAVAIPWLFGQVYCKFNIGFRFLLDFCLLVLPTMLCVTILADNTIALLSGGVSMVLSLLVFSDRRSKPSKPTQTQSVSLQTILERKLSEKVPFVTNYRAYANIATAVCILAVDFHIFPRRFAKAEMYGTGLMDAGVGSFVVSNAIVSPEARGKCRMARSLSGKLSNVAQSVKSTAPLWVIGLSRMVVVKALDYQEHVTEYGVHWNFFFTLAVVRVLSTAVLQFTGAGMSGLLSLVLAVQYQFALSNQGLLEFVLHGSDGRDSRRGFLDANREGICSCWGFLAVYFAGVELGKFIFKKRSTVQQWLVGCVQLLVSCGVFWVLLVLCEEYVEPVSRRTANLAYQLWMMVYNIQIIGSMLLVDLVVVIAAELRLVKREYSPWIWAVEKTADDSKDAAPTEQQLPDWCVLSAVNRNQLFFFLLANLLTGAVNLCVDTLRTEPFMAFCIVFAYMLQLCNVAVVLHARNISLKFW